ncbi:major facilitator superfamily domain-containing protein [Xylariomycetidae sp. FL0641]|nr:major facilitator superfamily domain-containing protein [Xylariomycetidae sp. FL0641]
MVRVQLQFPLHSSTALSVAIACSEVTMSASTATALETARATAPRQPIAPETARTDEPPRRDGHGPPPVPEEGVAEANATATAPSTTTTTTSSQASATAIFLLMAPLCLSVLLSALDLTIVTPAIPRIVSSLSPSSSSSSSSSGAYVWIGSAFVLASTASTPLWGAASDVWGRKPAVLAAVAAFGLGSLLCARAPAAPALVAGRAVQGLGSAGLGTLVNVLVCDAFSVRERGRWLALTSLVWAAGSAVGPVLGGLLTLHVGWRWCFWINLPIGGVVFLVLLLFLNVSNPRTPILAGLKSIDWLGSVLVIGSVLMVLLALDFGDVVFPWSSTTIICLIIFGAVVLGLFILNEWKYAKEPIIPLHLFTSKSSAASYAVYSCNFYVFIGLAYYLPLYSQAVLGVDALKAGVYLLPLVVGCSLSAAFAGIFIQRTGRYLPLMYAGQMLNVLGVGLFIDLKFEESLARLFVFQVLVGLGVGMNIEPPLIAVQAVNSERYTAAIVASMSFVRSIATAISIVVGGVIFQNEMTAENPKLVQQLGPQLAAQFNGDRASATVDLIHNLPSDQQDSVRRAYFQSLKSVWIMYVAFAGLSLALNALVRGHHLSTENRQAVLGLDRGDDSARASGTDAVELQELRARTVAGAETSH